MSRDNFPVATVTKNIREKQGLSIRAMAEALNEKLANTGVSFSAVSRWERGLDEPSTDFLLLVMMVYSDWRMEFAIDALCAKLPEVFARDTNGALTTLKQAIITE